MVGIITVAAIRCGSVAVEFVAALCSERPMIFVTTLLETNGFKPLSAEDGVKGLEIARKEAPSLIILDVMMPKESGITLYREIKNDPDYIIKVVMPADTNLTALAPDITIPAGFQITPASGEIVDFTSGPVTYTVDNNFSKISQSWDVSVVNAGPDIIGANLPSLNGDVVINGDPDYTVQIPVVEGTDLSDLSPEIFIYEGFTVTPESGSTNDFSSEPVTYTVSHQTLPLSQDWQVSVIETPVGINKIKDKEILYAIVSVKKNVPYRIYKLINQRTIY